MSANTYRTDLRTLIPLALHHADRTALEHYLTAHSNLPGPRGNLELIGAFADIIGEIITQPDPPVAQIETLLDGWAALPLDSAPVNDPREILPAVAALSYGQAAAARPDWWHDEIAKLHNAASDPRWRTREMVATGLQRMLTADWPRTYTTLNAWLSESDPLVMRAAVAAVAEPRLLTDQQRGMEALALQAKAAGWLAALPASRRRDESVRTLRQALGYTVSVTVVPVPDAGFDLLARLAQSPDQDVRWIVRENLKKNRLKRWAKQVTHIQALWSGL
ncbi:MAG: hypothetical protein IT324_02365 [Anaerolineae bacterium]|nr:hypothetical protein [Anaerolineae bacterium]